MRRPVELLIQQFVHTLDQGFGLRLIRRGLFCLCAVLLLLLYTGTQFKGLSDSAAMDVAQVGRNVAEGRGFRTRFIRPASMWYLATNGRFASSPRDVLDHPDLVHPPLWPLILAAGFRTIRPSFDAVPASLKFPPEYWVVVPLCHLFTLGTGLFLFLLGKRLLDRPMALLALGLFFLSDTVLANSISGLPLSLVSFLAMAAAYTACVAVRRKNEGRGGLGWWAALAGTGVLCGLAFLTRYGMVVLLPALMLFGGLALHRARVAWCGLLTAAFLVTVSPWLIRNEVVGGGPLGLAPLTALEDTETCPQRLFERTLLVQDVGKPWVTGNLTRKLVLTASDLLKNNVGPLGGGIFTAFFLATFLLRFANREAGLFRWALALALVLLGLAGCIYGPRTLALLSAFLPLVLLYGVAFLSTMLARLRLRLPLFNMACMVLAVLIGALPLILTLMPPRAGIPYPPYFPPIIARVAGMLKPDEVLCTDIPWATAWYGNRASVFLPASLDEFYKIHDNVVPIRGLYFTTETRAQPLATALLRGPYESWAPLVVTMNIPKDFPLQHGTFLWPDSPDQLFFSDYPRWSDGGGP